MEREDIAQRTLGARAAAISPEQTPKSNPNDTPPRTIGEMKARAADIRAAKEAAAKDAERPTNGSADERSAFHGEVISILEAAAKGRCYERAGSYDTLAGLIVDLSSFSEKLFYLHAKDVILLHLIFSDYIMTHRGSKESTREALHLLSGITANISVINDHQDLLDLAFRAGEDVLNITHRENLSA